jgi:hypothetical protein
VAFVAWHGRRPERADAAYVVSVSAPSKPPARWLQRIEGDTEIVYLNEGVFRISIHNHPPSRRVLFEVPDGELEDAGTIFDVAVRSGRTERIWVESGKIIARIGDAPAVKLGGGDSWLPSRVSLPSPEQLEHDQADGPPRQPRGRARLVTRGSPDRSNHVGPTAVPGDPASEDMAYLHVLDLLRASRMTEAKAAASDYLHRFPFGFRSQEVRTIAK